MALPQVLSGYTLPWQQMNPDIVLPVPLQGLKGF